MWDTATSEIVRNWAIVIGGAIGIGIAIWRAVAHSRQAAAQAHQARIQQRAHITEVFKDAVEQLGNDKLEIRLGAVLTLKRIATDFHEFDPLVVNLLTAYVRERAKTFPAEKAPTVDIVEVVKFLDKTKPEP